MRDYLPLLIVGGIIGLIAIVFIVAYATMKDKKEAIGFDRNMKDSDITRRLLAYARPHWKNLLLVPSPTISSLPSSSVALKKCFIKTLPCPDCSGL